MDGYLHWYGWIGKWVLMVSCALHYTPLCFVELMILMRSLFYETKYLPVVSDVVPKVRRHAHGMVDVKVYSVSA